MLLQGRLGDELDTLETEGQMLQRVMPELMGLKNILVLDGIHCGFMDDNPKVLNTRIISPFFDATRWAAEGKILFTITHSEVDPPTYAGTSQTADVLLDLVHGQREAPQPPPEHVRLKAAAMAVSKKLEMKRVKSPAVTAMTPGSAAG